jgi:hypothetical protein
MGGEGEQAARAGTGVRRWERKPIVHKNMQLINIKASFFAMDGNSTVGGKPATTYN